MSSGGGGGASVGLSAIGEAGYAGERLLEAIGAVLPGWRQEVLDGCPARGFRTAGRNLSSVSGRRGRGGANDLRTIIGATASGRW